MAKRKPLGNRRSKSLFTNAASKTHSINLRSVPMRGGFRI